MRPRAQIKPLLAMSLATATVALVACGGSSTQSTSQPSASVASTTPQTATTSPTPASTTPTTSTKAPSATPTTPAQPARVVRKTHLPKAIIELTSPAVNSAGVLASRYTCDGSNTSPSLRWSGVPHGTKELMLDVLNLGPVNGKLYFDWAVAAINPALHEIQAGKLPAGAVVGASSSGQARYALCPPNGSEAYVAVLFAFPHRLHTHPGFNATSLRLQALHEAGYEGILQYTYKRGG